MNNKQNKTQISTRKFSAININQSDYSERNLRFLKTKQNKMDAGEAISVRFGKWKENNKEKYVFIVYNNFYCDHSTSLKRKIFLKIYSNI